MISKLDTVSFPILDDVGATSWPMVAFDLVSKVVLALTSNTGVFELEFLDLVYRTSART